MTFDKDMLYLSNKLFIYNMIEKISTNKRERFKRLAVYRTNEILNKIRVLSNCSNRSAYEYTEEEVNKIFSEIEKTVKLAKSKFHYPKNKKFRL